MKRALLLLIGALTLAFLLFFWWSRSQFWWGFSGRPSRSEYFAYLYTNITFVTLLVVVGAAFTAFQQLRYLSEQAAASARDLRFQIYRDLLTMIDEFETERHRIEEDFPKDSASFDFESLPRERREQLERVCRSFDKLGMMVAQGIIPWSFLRDFHTRGLVVVWHRLAPFIKNLRNKRSQLGHMKQFQMLAIEAKKRRDALYPDEETFDLSSEEESMWSEWHQIHGPKFWI